MRLGAAKTAVAFLFGSPIHTPTVEGLANRGLRYNEFHTEDLAFEEPVGGSPKEGHHVRFWRREKMDELIGLL
jgi:hypothetical protein